jgi:NAD(P)H dehydrogenase (quinone)
MPTIAVTGATGQLGHLVVEALLERGVDPASIVAIVRDAGKAEDLAARGVQVREADYDRPDTLAPALDGVQRLLLVSSSEVGRREAQHANVIAAAKTAGVALLAYTSVVNADTTKMLLAAEHQATERAIRASGLPFVLLRNGWYTENYTGPIAQTIEHGGLVGSGGEGRIAPAPRRDFAEATAAVLVGEGHEGRAYELAGDEALTLAEIAGLLSELTGQELTYRDVPVEAYTEILEGAGLPPAFTPVIADTTVAAVRGELVSDSGDLARLLGRPTTPVADAFRAELA